MTWRRLLKTSEEFFHVRKRDRDLTELNVIHVTRNHHEIHHREPDTQIISFQLHKENSAENRRHQTQEERRMKKLFQLDNEIRKCGTVLWTRSQESALKIIFHTKRDGDKFKEVTIILSMSNIVGNLSKIGRPHRIRHRCDKIQLLLMQCSVVCCGVLWCGVVCCIEMTPTS